MKHVSGLDRAVAAQSAKLQQRRQHIQQRKIGLHNGALNFCRKPSTLVWAFFAGAVLATLYPPERTHHPVRALSTGIWSFLRNNFSTSLQLVLLNAFRRLLTPAKQNPDVEQTAEFPH